MSYGQGGVLGAAVLPATSASSLFLLNSADSIVVAGLFIVSLINFLVLTAYISRYLFGARK